jgi:hypothetical protein
MGGSPSTLSIKSISKNPEDRIFKSKRFSRSIKNNLSEVEQEYDKFSKNETNMELLSRQATTVSRKDMTKILIKWTTELKLNKSAYSDLKDLFAVGENNYWPQHLSTEPLWETTQDNNAMTNMLYIYVYRTDVDTDAQMFDVAICHLVTKKSNISQDVLIGDLCKKDLLRRDDDYNVYLNFHR